MNIFKELIGQFLRQKQELVPYCYDKRMTSGDVTLNSMSLVDVMLKVFIDAIPQVFIIIDGLDECQPVERKIVLTKLSELVHHCDRGVPGKLRVLFVSQYSKDIQKCIPGDASVLPLSSGDSRADIKEYVRIYSEKLQEKQGLDLDELEKLREKIWLRSDGMKANNECLIVLVLTWKQQGCFCTPDWSLKTCWPTSDVVISAVRLRSTSPVALSKRKWKPNIMLLAEPSFDLNKLT